MSISNTVIRTALADLATVLKTVNPTPSSGPVGVWTHPAEWDAIDLSRLPVIVVARALDQEETWGVFSTFGTDYHFFTAEILVILSPFPKTQAAGKDMEIEGEPWIPAIVNCLRATGDDLSNTVREIGRNDGLLSVRQGGIEWAGKPYWGYRILLPVTIEGTK